MELESRQSPEGLYWPRVHLQAVEEPLYHGKATMCRTATHKYVRRLGDQDELYDLMRDPGELHNVVADPAYREVLLALKERLLAFYHETADVVPRDTDRRG
jgi:arylsulfatase A-like enzyme